MTLEEIIEHERSADNGLLSITGCKKATLNKVMNLFFPEDSTAIKRAGYVSNTPVESGDKIFIYLSLNRSVPLGEYTESLSQINLKIKSFLKEERRIICFSCKDTSTEVNYKSDTQIRLNKKPRTKPIELTLVRSKHFETGETLLLEI